MACSKRREGTTQRLVAVHPMLQPTVDSDADLDARIRDISARLLGLPASHDPDPDEQRLDECIRQLVASLAAEGADVKGYYGAPQ